MHAEVFFVWLVMLLVSSTGKHANLAYTVNQRVARTYAQPHGV
jgi:hypothetical protein